MIRIVLPYPPSIWEMYEGWGKSRHLSPVYAKWRNDAGQFMKGRHQNQIAVPFNAAIDTLSAARDRAARVAGIDRSYAKRIWDRWQTMNDVSGEAYRRLREAYERACERHEAAAAEYRQQRLLIEATRHAVSESPDYGGMGVPVPEMVQTTTRESAAK